MKRMRRDRMSIRSQQGASTASDDRPPDHAPNAWPERDRPARTWGRERANDMPREHRERDRRKRRAGGDEHG